MRSRIVELLATPAFWSAIAASFSALSAIVLVAIQRRNLLESVRPVIALDKWERRSPSHEAEVAEIAFRSLKNVGKGPALHVYVQSVNVQDNRPVAIMPTFNTALLASNEAIDVNHALTVFFKNVGAVAGQRVLAQNVTISCLDLRGRVHITVYRLLVFGEPQTVYAGNVLAPGVVLGVRESRLETVFRRNLRRRLRKVPLVKQFVLPDWKSS